MKFQSKSEFKTPEARKSFAYFMAGFIEGGSIYKDRFEPYLPMPDNDTFWTLDSGNDWKLIFLPDEPNCFIIRYRYQNPTNQKEEALAAWLQVRINVTILTVCS